MLNLAFTVLKNINTFLKMRFILTTYLEFMSSIKSIIKCFITHNNMFVSRELDILSFSNQQLLLKHSRLIINT